MELIVACKSVEFGVGEVLLRSSCRRNVERSLYTNERFHPLTSAYGMDPGCWIEDRWKASVDGRAQPDALSVG